jgi:hypothetical protein
MYPSPFVTELWNGVIERLAKLPDGPPRKAIVLAKRDRTGRAIQIEDCLVAAPEDMHVRRNVIGRVDDDSKAVKP